MAGNEARYDEAISLPWAHLRVPPFPQTAIRVLQSVNDDGASIRRLSDLITSEPAFSSEVLTIANSALCPHRHPVTSVSQAIALLGTDTLKGLCLTVGVRAYLGKSMNHPSLRAIWRHSLACGLIAEKIALAGVMDKDIAYTAGIMHDIGRFALAILRPEKYVALLESYRGSPAGMLEAERELFGFDHCQAGRHLVTEWKLPPEFEPIIADHHSPGGKSSRWQMAELINMSCRMADSCGFDVFGGCDVTPYSDLLEELPDRERRLFEADVESLAFEVSRKINAVESL